MKTFLKHYKVLIILTLLVVGVAVFYMTYTGKAVSQYVENFENTYGPKEDSVGGKVNLFRVPGYHDLLKQRGLLDGLAKLAQTDSVGLFLNLPDSTAQLMIKGVAVRTLPIQEMGLGAMFRHVSDEALYQWLSEPLEVTGSIATIAKQPINVVVAPKDSNDSIPEVKPDTSHVEPVFFILETNRDVRLYFYETDDISQDKRAGRMFGWADRWKTAREELKAVFSFTVPEYRPTIRIGVSKEDAKVLYRALPAQGKIVLTM